MSHNPGLDTLKALNRQLTELLADPQPGLHTWKLMLSDTLMRMADYAGHGMVSEQVGHRFSTHTN